MSITYQEIKSQYEALNHTAKYVDEHMEELKPYITNKKLLAFVGCGSSYSIAKSMAMTANMFSMNAVALAGGDVLIHAQAYKTMLNDGVIVIVSRSGSTSELMLMVEALKQAGCQFSVVSVACTEGSQLAKISQYCLEMPWAFDNSVCQTRTVSCLYFSVMYALHKLAGLDETLKTAINGGEAFMNAHEPVLKEIGQKNWKSAVVLADAQLLGIAEEGALAYKEICQVPSNFYHMLDSRHGPMVLVDQDTLVVIALSDPANQYERALVEDVVKKGATAVVYSDMGANIPNTTDISFGSQLNHGARGIPFILINQLIAYYKSGVTGADPDKPSGLDAWIKL